MSLQTELRDKIDSTALVTTLLSGLTSAAGNLSGVAAPADADQLSGAGQNVGAVDPSRIGPIVDQVIDTITPLLKSLPAAQEVLRPITASLDLIEDGFTNVDLRKQIEDLSKRLGKLLEGPKDEGFIGVLVQFADVLSTAPESQKLSALLSRLLETANVSMPTLPFSISEAAPAIQSAVTTVGGLMSLESLLSEAERLTTVMATQLDTSAVNLRRDALVACLTGGPTPLTQFVAGINVNSPAQVAAARAAIRRCSRSLADLVDLYSQGSAFGEATLVYLDLPNLQSKVVHATSLVRNADLDPLERTLRSVQASISSALTIDLSGAPSFLLDDLISNIEGRVTEVAAGIDTFDLSEFTNPLIRGIGQVTALPRMLDSAIGQVTLEVQAALGRISDALAALPLQSIGNAIRQVLQPLTKALEFLSALVDTIKVALEAAITALKTGLNAVEATVDQFKQDIEAMFNDAATFIASLNLDQVLVKIAESVKAFAELIEKAQMKPYFDTTIDVIDTTTGVVENVPFSLLPDSMEQEVVGVLRPIKAVNLDSIKSEIESLLQIGPDGKFKLRPDIEAAVADIQAKYEALITELKELDPQKVVDRVDVELKKLAAKIEVISPQVELKPVQDAIDQLREVMSSFDLNATLQPLRDAFDALRQEAEKYSPAALITPLETKLDEARDHLVEATKLREAAAHLDLLASRATELLSSLDPAQLEASIEEGMREALQLLDAFPQFQFAGGLGTLVTSLLTGLGLQVEPLAFEAVLGWLQGTPGAAFLVNRSRRITDAIATSRAAVAAFDPADLAVSLMTQLRALSAAVAQLPAGAARTSLEAEVANIDLSALGNLTRNRERYLAALTAGQGVAESLSNTGLSEVDIKITQLQTAFAPLAPLKDLLLDILARLGITGLEQGIGEALRRLFAVATPERIAGIIAPIYRALHARIMGLINAVLNPLKDGIRDLLAAVDKIDLTPLREQLDSLFQAALQQIGSLHPDLLLGDVVAALTAAKAQVAEFNPLVELETALTELRDTTTRVLGKLSANEIMATPLQVYAMLVGLFSQLDLDALLQPLYEQLDNIAGQVNEGLTNTVESFGRLQDALPDTVGSVSV